MEGIVLILPVTSTHMEPPYKIHALVKYILNHVVPPRSVHHKLQLNKIDTTMNNGQVTRDLLWSSPSRQPIDSFGYS